MNKIILYSFFISFFLTSCGIYKKTDRDTPQSASDRAQKNIKEGRGVSIGSVLGGGKRGTNYEFSTSNPMWRATLEALDFLPLSTVDYSGGIIITDWYNDESNSSKTNSSIKITVRMLTNEIRSDALDVKVFLKTCSQNSNNCTISQKNNNLTTELKFNILKRASRYEKERLTKYKKENPYNGSTPSKEKDKPKKKKKD